MKRYSTLLVGDPNSRVIRALYDLGPITVYSKGMDLGDADLFAVDVQNLGGLDAEQLFVEALAAECSLVVFNLDTAASDLLMKITGARPPANSFGAVYRRTQAPGAARRLFHSFIPNYSQTFRDHIDKERGGFDKMFDGFVCAGLKRHFRAIEKAAISGGTQGSMTPPFSQAPFSQVTTAGWGLTFPVSGAQQLSQTSFDLTANFYFYNSDANQESSQNEYLVVVVVSLTSMTPGGVVSYTANNNIGCCSNIITDSQYTQVFSYGATVQPLQQSSWVPWPYPVPFASGVSMGTTSPAANSSPQPTLVDVLSSPTPVMNVTSPSGPEISSTWTPTYSNTITQTGSPNLMWYTVVNTDNMEVNLAGCTFVMPESMWGGGNVNPNQTVSNTSTMAMEFINYFTFNSSLVLGTEPNQSLPVVFSVTAIAFMQEDVATLTINQGGSYSEDSTSATMWSDYNNQSYTYDLVKLSALGPM